MKIINTILKFLPLALLFRTGYTQPQFIFRFHGVANTSDDNTPNWSVTSNPEHQYALGTQQFTSNDPYYFTTNLFDTSSTVGSVASHSQIADINCTIADDTLKVIFPTPTDAFFIYRLKGEFCADNGSLKITHLNVSAEHINEIETITAIDFPGDGLVNNGTEWVVPPPSNYDRSDVIIPAYTQGSDILSISRAGVTLTERGVPLQINITRAFYDFNLQKHNVSYAFYDLTSYPNQTLIQWQYTAPYLAIASLSVGSKTIFLNVHSPDSAPVKASITLPQRDDQLMYHMSLHYLNPTTFLLYSLVNNFEETPEPFLFLLHSISINGQVELIGSKPTGGVTALLVLQKEHGEFERDGVLSLENTVNALQPNITYFHNHQQRSYLLPDSPWWLLAGIGNHPRLAESNNALYIDEMQKLQEPGYGLGCYVLPWPKPKPTPTSQTSSSNTQPISTSRNTFFSSAVNDRSEPISDNNLALGLSVGFILLIGCSITAYLMCRKKDTHQPLQTDNMYTV